MADCKDVRFNAKNMNSIRVTYEMVVLPQVLDDLKNLIIEIVSPTFGKSKRVLKG